MPVLCFRIETQTHRGVYIFFIIGCCILPLKPLYDTPQLHQGTCTLPDQRLSAFARHSIATYTSFKLFYLQVLYQRKTKHNCRLSIKSAIFLDYWIKKVKLCKFYNALICMLVLPKKISLTNLLMKNKSYSLP